MQNNKTHSSPPWPCLSLVVPFVALVIALLDIALLERKFHVFSGGFLQLNPIVGFSGRLAFCGFIYLLEFAFASSCWYLLRLTLGARRGSSSMNMWQFILLYGVGSVLALIAKYQILSYFGDFISMAVLRNLGGGDLGGALLYALEEGQWLAVCVGAIGAIAWLIRYRTGKKAAPVAPFRSRAETRRLFASFAVSLVALVALAYGASKDSTTRRNFKTLTPYWLANEFNSLWRTPEPSVLARLSKDDALRLPTAIPSKFSFGARKDNLILIVSESTRADVLDAEFAGKVVTPNLRSLAKDGGSAPRYYSHTGFTTSSLKAIFNGALGEKRPLGGTLFEILKKNGYQVVVISGQNEAFGDIAKDSDLESTADLFFDARSAKNERVFSSAAAGSLALSNQRVVEQFDKFSARIDWTRPVFIYLNFQSAHFPYFHKGMPVLPGVTPLERGDISYANRTELRTTYLNAVASSDEATGQVVDRLKKLGMYDKSLVVVSGDHGESLFDDGILGHGIRITDAQMHTLLVANRKLPEFSTLLGETDLAHALMIGLGATDASPRAAASPSVLHYIGDLSSPQELGYTYADGRHLVLDNVNDEVRASGLENSYRSSELPSEGWASRELSRLIAEWRSIRSVKNPCVSTTPGCLSSKKPRADS